MGYNDIFQSANGRELRYEESLPRKEVVIDVKSHNKRFLYTAISLIAACITGVVFLI